MILIENSLFLRKPKKCSGLISLSFVLGQMKIPEILPSAANESPPGSCSLNIGPNFIA